MFQSSIVPIQMSKTSVSLTPRLLSDNDIKTVIWVGREKKVQWF